jgi:hypothetical protein
MLPGCRELPRRSTCLRDQRETREGCAGPSKTRSPRSRGRSTRTPQTARMTRASPSRSAHRRPAAQASSSEQGRRVVRMIASAVSEVLQARRSADTERINRRSRRHATRTGDGSPGVSTRPPAHRERELAAVRARFRVGRIASARLAVGRAPASAYARRGAAVRDCRSAPLDRPGTKRERSHVPTLAWLLLRRPA